MVYIAETRYPGICNGCSNISVYYIRAGIHTLQLCKSCLDNLALEVRTLYVTKEEVGEYNNSKETGLIR